MKPASYPRCFLLFLVVTSAALSAAAQDRVGVGTTAPDPSSILDISSTSKGVLVPRLTLQQRTNVIAPAEGLLVYQKDEDTGFYFYKQGWKRLVPSDLANNTLSNLAAPVAVNTDLLPQTTLTWNVGSSANQWKDVYLGGDMFLKQGRFLATRGNNNFFGLLAGNASVTGSYNTATGGIALATNVTGNWNTATGYQSLTTANNSYSNTATGFQALLATTSGSYNTATGVLSLGAVTNGVSNSGYGVASLNNVSGGSYNLATGYFAGSNLAGGNYNSFLGSYADVPAGTTLSNATAIGYNTQISASNAVRVGNVSVNSIGGYAGWTTFPSDGRFKKNVKQDVPGLSFINGLRPVTYNINVEAIETALNPAPAKSENKALGTVKVISQEETKARAEKSAIVYSGFIAQEVAQTAKELNYNFSGVDSPKEGAELYGLRYSDFVVPLVKAVQELSKENKEIKAQLAALQQQVDKLLQKIK